jgi:hypothetical protein
MASKLLSSTVGGGGLPQLAPDLTFPSSLAGNAGYKRITGINAVGTLTTALSLSGKFYVNALRFEAITAETITIKLTVDGVVIWDDTWANIGTILKLFGRTGADATATDETVEAIQCNESFLLELQTLTDASVTLVYLARPIL